MGPFCRNDLIFCNLKCYVTNLQIDLVAGKAKNWYDEGAVPSEPFFVARPGATEEDDGEFVSIVLSLFCSIIIYKTSK